MAAPLVEAAAPEEIIESLERALGYARLVRRAVRADRRERLVQRLPVVVHHQDSRSWFVVSMARSSSSGRVQSPGRGVRKVLYRALNVLKRGPRGHRAGDAGTRSTSRPRCESSPASSWFRAPERLSIVFASRQTPPIPFARMRAAGEVAEIGTDDLRFDAAGDRASVLRDLRPRTRAGRPRRCNNAHRGVGRLPPTRPGRPARSIAGGDPALRPRPDGRRTGTPHSGRRRSRRRCLVVGARVYSRACGSRDRRLLWLSQLSHSNQLDRPRAPRR